MKSQNLTIVFVDIKDFTTRTSAQSRGENERLLQRFEMLVRPMVKAFGGRIVKSIGDAFLMTFHSPTDALHCAMAIQDQLTRDNEAQQPGDRFEVRLAVNTGEVRVEGGDVFGEAVNIASRIESLADGGEIYFSEAVYLVMNKSEVPFEEVGYKTLKGIPEPVKIYRVPRISEVGDYRVKGSGLAPAKEKVENPGGPPDLPFGGYGLQRARPRMLQNEAEQVKAVLRRSHQKASEEMDKHSQELGANRLLAVPKYVGAFFKEIGKAVKKGKKPES